MKSNGAAAVLALALSLAAAARAEGAVTTLTPYLDALPIPPVASPISEDGGVATYEIAIRQTTAQLHHDLPKTTVWGYDDGVSGPVTPGPTIEAYASEAVTVKWSNDLRNAAGKLLTKHALAVDPCAEGATDDTPRTVVHLHGGHVPSRYDGAPDQALLPGQDATYAYANTQPAATLWYHDDALGIARLNITMGLSGLYLLRDDDETALALPTGKYEIPLVIQDRSFDGNGQFQYPATWADDLYGDTALVNGKVWPYLNVDRGLYRFRILNASNARVYTFTLSTTQPFRQIGTDGGLLDHPIAMNQLTLAPGERADVLIDFGSAHEGDEIILGNTAPAPFRDGVDGHPLPNVMKFVVGKKVAPAVDVPLHLRSIVPIDEKTAVQTREFVLAKQDGSCSGTSFTINGEHWDDVSVQPLLGTTEIWHFTNQTRVALPVHLHLVTFQILDRTAPPPIPDAGAAASDASTRARTDAGPGTLETPLGADKGWKDTVLVRPFETVRVIAKFADYAGRFSYQAGSLEQVDNAMQLPFQATSVCGDNLLTDDEECDDGNTTDADGCSATCTREIVPPKVRPKHVPPAPWKGDGCACRFAPNRSSNNQAPAQVTLLFVLLALTWRRKEPHSFTLKSAATFTTSPTQTPR